MLSKIASVTFSNAVSADSLLLSYIKCIRYKIIFFQKCCKLVCNYFLENFRYYREYIDGLIIIYFDCNTRFENRCYDIMFPKSWINTGDYEYNNDYCPIVCNCWNTIVYEIMCKNALAPTEIVFLRCFINDVIASFPSGCSLKMFVKDLISFMLC